jgi:hypothetical protein
MDQVMNAAKALNQPSFEDAEHKIEASAQSECKVDLTGS